MPHHDPDYGRFDLSGDPGELTIHRESAATGDITTMPLGTAATGIARDILRLSGQANATLVQSVADTLEARAAWEMPLTLREMRDVAATLRRGVGARLDAVVVDFPRRVSGHG